MNFAGENCKKISYAASFGFEVADDSYLKSVINEISKFDKISVRENTGLQVLEQLKCVGSIVCDPTLLIDKNNYNELADRASVASKKVFSFILHKHQEEAWKIVDYVKDCYCEKITPHNNKIMSVYEWLNCIRQSEIVVTNSFHAVMFSLIFNRPFIVLPVAGSKMNDRICTILDKVELSNRFVKDGNLETINRILNTTIDWAKVNQKTNKLRKEGQKF